LPSSPLDPAASGPFDSGTGAGLVRESRGTESSVAHRNPGSVHSSEGTGKRETPGHRSSLSLARETGRAAADTGSCSVASARSIHPRSPAHPAWAVPVPVESRRPEHRSGARVSARRISLRGGSRRSIALRGLRERSQLREDQPGQAKAGGQSQQTDWFDKRVHKGVPVPEGENDRDGSCRQDPGSLFSQPR
jgi:hypothetical protein